MSLESQYNMRSPAVKRLMKEAQELKDATEDYYAQPLEDNLFEWHFTVRGPAETEFEGGIYHGRIILPPEYPMKPPSIILLTPNGRFEVHKKICLSISGHHPESWRPSWSIRTALLAIIGFMPTPGNSAIGSLDYTGEERKILAKKSLEWECSLCGDVKPLVRKLSGQPSSTSLEAKELAQQISFKSETDKAKDAAAAAAVATAEEASGDSPTASPTGTAVTVQPSSTQRDEDARRETLRLSNELRQRFAANRQRVATRINSVMANVETVHATTAITEQENQSPGGTWSMVLIVVLSLGLAFLLLRRILLTL